MSYRSCDPLRVVGEITHWEGHSADQIRQMKAALERLKTEGAEIVD